MLNLLTRNLYNRSGSPITMPQTFTSSLPDSDREMWLDGYLVNDNEDCSSREQSQKDLAGLCALLTGEAFAGGVEACWDNIRFLATDIVCPNVDLINRVTQLNNIREHLQRCTANLEHFAIITHFAYDADNHHSYVADAVARGYDGIVLGACDSLYYDKLSRLSCQAVYVCRQNVVPYDPTVRVKGNKHYLDIIRDGTKVSVLIPKVHIGTEDFPVVGDRITTTLKHISFVHYGKHRKGTFNNPVYDATLDPTSSFFSTE